jgi:hypothetical protein
MFLSMGFTTGQMDLGWKMEEKDAQWYGKTEESGEEKDTTREREITISMQNATHLRKLSQLQQ